MESERREPLHPGHLVMEKLHDVFLATVRVVNSVRTEHPAEQNARPSVFRKSQGLHRKGAVSGRGLLARLSGNRSGNKTLPWEAPRGLATMSLRDCADPQLHAQEPDHGPSVSPCPLQFRFCSVLPKPILANRPTGDAFSPQAAQLAPGRSPFAKGRRVPSQDPYWEGNAQL